ncbi:MAG: tRNA pseudouridine(55) synthase TruB, partial [Proteobacteria bacterium]|nr:tRNA pseudouridine(55) synthase TruB [Pseudomonadota bacterium]
MSVLILNKPKDLSSFKSLKEIQNLLGLRKAGHAGTLDPLATGILPIFFDRSTKFIQYMPEQDKTYQAKFQLGCSSDTEDV